MKRSFTRKWISFFCGVLLSGSLVLTSCSDSGSNKKTTKESTKKTTKETTEEATEDPTADTEVESTAESTVDTEVDPTVHSTEETNMDQKNKKVLRFSSFDGGGFSYTVTIDDPSIVSYDSYKDYGGQDPGEIDGASFDYTVELIPLSEGTTTLTVKGESPIMEPEVYYYQLTVGSDLDLQVAEMDAPDQEETSEET